MIYFFLNANVVAGPYAYTNTLRFERPISDCADINLYNNRPNNVATAPPKLCPVITIL